MSGAAAEALRAALAARLERDDHPLGFECAAALPAPAGTRLDRLGFRSAGGAAVRGFLCRPLSPGPHPAVLVIHAHGGRYGIGADELMDGRPALQGPWGPALAARGIASLCLDLPCFGERQAPAEAPAAKAALWEGRSLAGQMLGECASAFRWLAARPDVVPGRVGVAGISMGATLGYWLAAVEPRVAALAHLCCFADFRALIAAGAHDLHGIYLTVPGLLPLAANGVIAGLVAPRPQFAGIGDLDPLTPPEAVDIALAETRAAYGPEGRFVLHREPGAGHWETPAMRDAMLAHLAAALGTEAAQGGI
jgi:hypothetical protein